MKPHLTSLPPVVCFGNDWFADNRTSSHQIARQLAQRTRVLYFGCPGLRAPSGNARDLRRLMMKLSRAGTRSVVTPEGVRVRTLAQLPLHGSAWASRLNAAFSRFVVGAALEREQMTEPIVWCTVPHVAPFVADLPRSLLVYHCIDDYAALPGVNVEAVRRMDQQLAGAADLVFAASSQVYEEKRRCNPGTIRVPHGVDAAHFAQASDGQCSAPGEFTDLPKPVIGFIGLIERWIDLDLVEWLARALPQTTFLMVGRVAVPKDELPAAPNIHFIGPRPYADLPRYGAHFDAAIIPYALTPQVLAANPIKLREYLAMGLPVVSVSTPEIEEFRHVVSIARTRDEFLAALRRVLSDGRAAGRRRRMESVQGATWGARMQVMTEHVHRALDRRGSPAA